MSQAIKIDELKIPKPIASAGLDAFLAQNEPFLGTKQGDGPYWVKWNFQGPRLHLVLNNIDKTWDLYLNEVVCEDLAQIITKMHLWQPGIGIYAGTVFRGEVKVVVRTAHRTPDERWFKLVVERSKDQCWFTIELPDLLPIKFEAKLIED